MKSSVAFLLLMVVLGVVTVATVIIIRDREQRRIDSLYAAHPSAMDSIINDEQAETHRRNGEL